MTQANPFAQAQPAAAPQQPEQPATGNPFAQQQAAPATSYGTGPVAQTVPQQPQQGNPFAPAVQQQAPAQAYAPQQTQQAPQYGVQAGGAPAPQWLAQQAPVQQQAAQVPTGPPPALNASGLVGAPPPPPAGDGRGAKLPDMYGRLVLVFPHSITRRPRNPQYITAEQRAAGNLEQDQVTATVVVLDDGQGGMQPIAFGGAPYELPPRPHTESSPLPYVRKAMWITQSRLIGQLRDFLPSAPGGQGGMVCGRVVKAGPQRNDPWYLQGATAQELGLAEVYLQLVANGTYPHPLA